ncbi:MAG: ABC transporter ATP-binding protein [Chloroflexota bacterium]|nr:ABC transporter ATP-binding protein [Chloroflexota bacterium]
MHSESVIRVQDLSKAFDSEPVLRDLSLEVMEGEIYGLIGPSGSGKTTTIRLLLGQLTPTDGTATVLGEQPTSFATATRRRLGYMAQDFVLYPTLTIEQNVSFAAGLYGLPEWRYRDRIREILELVELWEDRGKEAREASGGMKRRTALAAALVHEPVLLFADEPTANLDPILRAKLWEYFHTLTEQGRTLLITTQYIDEAEYCTRVGLMFEGALIAEGEPETLRREAFGGDVVEIVLEHPATGYDRTLTNLVGVRATEVPPDRPIRVTVDSADEAIPDLVDAFEAAGAAIHSIAPYQPTFDEVFIRLIERSGRARPPSGMFQLSPVAGS